MPGWTLWATVGVPDVAAARGAYAALGFRPAWKGRLPAAAAARWGAPASGGRDAAILAPPGQGGGVRLVETDSAVAPALGSLGWAALELASNDLPEMRRRLAAGGFRLLGDIAPLGSNPAIRALQAAGAAGEAVYVADLSAYAGAFDLIRPRAALEGMFIAVLAAADLAATRAAHVAGLGAETRSDSEVAVPVLNRARGLPEGTRHRISTSQLPGSCAIEVDQATAGLPRRAAAPGQVPAGFFLLALAQALPGFDAPARLLPHAPDGPIEIVEAA